MAAITTPVVFEVLIRRKGDARFPQPVGEVTVDLAGEIVPEVYLPPVPPLPSPKEPGNAAAK